MTQSIEAFIKDVDGWLTVREEQFLYNKVRACSGKGVIVEIGSWKGRSTICLGKGSQAGNKVGVYAIDTFTGNPEHAYLGNEIYCFDVFKKNIKNAGLERLIVPIVKDSQEAAKDWDMPIQLLFIDGAHEYEFVEKDFLSWSRYLVDGGIIAMPDTTACLRTLLHDGQRGPRKVADKYIYHSEKVKDVGLVDTITYARKCRRNTPPKIGPGYNE